MTAEQLPNLPAADPQPASAHEPLFRGRQAVVTLVEQPWLRGLILFSTAIALFAVIQWATPGIVGNDGYYHIKMGYLMRQEGLTPAFEALPHTILNADAYYDHHLLFHLFLAPFAGVDPAVDGGAALTRGAKIAAVLLPALAVVAVWWLLRGRGVPLAGLWALGLFAVSAAFLYRLSMGRAQAGAVLFLALALHWLLNGRHKWLAPLGFLFVWFYNAFPLLLVVAGVYVVGVFMLERRVAWTALAFPAAGIALGLLINPYFPENIVFIVGHLLPKVGQSAVPVGNEWSPYETWTLATNSAGALAAVLLGALALGWREERIDLASLVGLGLVGVFGLMLFKSRRFVEYFPVFALVFLAFSSAPLVRQFVNGLKERGVAGGEANDGGGGAAGRGAMDGGAAGRRANDGAAVGGRANDGAAVGRRANDGGAAGRGANDGGMNPAAAIQNRLKPVSSAAPRWAMAVVVALALGALIYITMQDARALVADSKPADMYAGAMLFLRAEAEALGSDAGSVTVFQTDWDDFTRQFFYYDDARYINGLDPTFMQLYDAGLYDEWVDITRGRVESPGAAIRDRFGAQFVFSDLDHEAFLERAAEDPALRELYRDEYAVVFAVP